MSNATANSREDSNSSTLPSIGTACAENDLNGDSIEIEITRGCPISIADKDGIVDGIELDDDRRDVTCGGDQAGGDFKDENKTTVGTVEKINYMGSIVSGREKIEIRKCISEIYTDDDGGGDAVPDVHVYAQEEKRRALDVPKALVSRRGCVEDSTPRKKGKVSTTRTTIDGATYEGSAPSSSHSTHDSSSNSIKNVCNFKPGAFAIESPDYDSMARQSMDPSLSAKGSPQSISNSRDDACTDGVVTFFSAEQTSDNSEDGNHHVVQAVCVEDQHVFEAKLVAQRNLPDSGRSSRRRWYSIVAIALISLLAMIITLSTTLSKESEVIGSYEDKNESVQSSDEFYQNYVEVLRSILAPLNEENVFDESSSEFSSDRKNALDWLARDNWFTVDALENNKERIRQRYIAALFYFSTNGPEWKEQFSFLSNRHECDWSAVQSLDTRNGAMELNVAGIICHGEEAERLTMEWNNLSGTIPPELSYLSTSLIELNIGGGSLSGTIPPSLRELGMLRTLGLNDHCLSGSIPNFSDLPYIETITLQNNPELSGSLNLFCDGLDYKNPDTNIIKSTCGGLLARETSSSVECDCCTCCNEDDFTCCNQQGDFTTSLYLNELSPNGFISAFEKRCLPEKQKEWIEHECPCLLNTGNSFRPECTRDCETEGAIPSKGH